MLSKARCVDIAPGFCMDGWMDGSIGGWMDGSRYFTDETSKLTIIVGEISP